MKGLFKSERVPLFYLVIILALALALRLYHLDFQSLWIDEIASMQGSDPDLTVRALIHYTKGDQPPAFFLLLHLWMKIFSFDDYSGRLLSVVIGIAGIIAMFALGKEIKDTRLGLVAALITSINYIHIYFSQETRFYTLVFFASTLSVLFFIRAIKSERIVDFLGYVLSTTLLIYSHYFGLVMLATQGLIFIWIVLMFPVKRQFVFSAIISAVAIALLILPWIPVFFSDVKEFQAFWIPPEPWYFPAKYFYVFFKDIPSCLIFCALILSFLFTLLRKEKRSNEDIIMWILIAIIVLNFAIPTLYSIVRTPMLRERYLLIALPSIIIVISLAFSLIQWRIRIALLALICISTLTTLFLIEKYYSTPIKEDWRGLVKGVMQNLKQDDAMISDYSWYCNYYFKSLGSDRRVIFSEEFDWENSRPAAIWYLEGFDLPTEANAWFGNNGYQLQRTDSLFRVRASYYVREEMSGE